MIAQSPPAAPRAIAATADEPLTPLELHRLTLYKWRYSLEAFGFAPDQVSQLVFLKWLHTTGRLAP